MAMNDQRASDLKFDDEFTVNDGASWFRCIRTFADSDTTISVGCYPISPVKDMFAVTWFTLENDHSVIIRNRYYPTRA